MYLFVLRPSCPGTDGCAVRLARHSRGDYRSCRERGKKSDCFRVKLNDSTRYTKIFSSLLLKMMHSRDEATAIVYYKGIVSIELTW